MAHSRNCNIFIFGLGTALVILGLSLGIYGPTLFSKLYREQLQLAPFSPAFKLWSHTPIPLYLEVYLFNWTNAKEFMENKSTVPYFEEVGPFVFKEVHDRVNVVWNDNNTVTYNQSRRWNFVPEKSEDLSIKITNLNVIATTFSQLVKNLSKLKWVINYEFDRHEHFLSTAPAKNWLFEGIDDKLLDILTPLLDIINIPITMKKFGWFYGRNMSSSYDGIFTVKTGTDNIYTMGNMDKWNRMNKTNFYKNECAMVNGTSGELFPPMNSIQDNITVFISDICSSITLHYNGSSFVEGIEGHKYVGKETSLDNGQFFPENKCFCGNECAPYGARDVSACRFAPLYFSFPHFYLADESYRNSVSGMMPNSSEHEFMIQLDPVTGIPTNVKAQLQINVRLEPVSWLKMFSGFPKLFIPMMWFRERASITPELATKAFLIQIIPEASIGLCYVILGIGLLIITVRLFVIWRRYRDSSDSELLIPPLMDQDDDEYKFLNEHVNRTPHTQNLPQTRTLHLTNNESTEPSTE